MNVFCNNALPAPSPGEEYPSAWTNIMMFLPGGQDFYNQNSYIFGVTYNGVDYDSTAPNAIAAPECIDIKERVPLIITIKTPLSVVEVLSLNYQ